MKVLIIGGSGRISLMTAQELYAAGHDVLVINRGHNNAGLGSIPTISGDINDRPFMNGLLSKCSFDVVLQFVAFDGNDIQRDYQYFAHKGIHYIVTSTCVTYSRFDYDGLIQEDHLQENPYSEYGRRKIDMEKALWEIHKKDHSFIFTILRPSHTYDYRAIPVCLHGKNGTYSVLKRIKEGKPVILPNDGKNIWPVLYAKDFAKGVLGLLKNPKAYWESFNITSEERHSWNELYGIIGEIVGKKPNIVYLPAEVLAHEQPSLEAALLGDKALNSKIDNTKLISIVPEFRNQVPLKDSLKETITFIEQHKEYQKDDPEFDSFTDSLIKKFS